MKNQLKPKLVQGQTVIGCVVTINSPTVADLLASVGLDFLWFDMEHGPLGLESIQAMIAATNGRGVSPIVRVPWNDPVIIKRVLDVGPEGVLIPLVNTKAQAELAVKACKYPPAGIRGVGLGRAHGYGMTFGEYLATADRELMVILQIEHIEAVNHIAEILTVGGIDLLFVGPYDLSGSMGRLGQTEHPEVQEAVGRVVRACQEARMPLGTFAGTVDAARRAIQRGFQFISFGVDTAHLAAAMKTQLAQIRVGERPSPVARA